MDPMHAQLDAFNNRDLEAFLVCYAPDVVIEGPDGAPMMRGHDEMRALYGRLFAQSPDLHCEVTSRIRVGCIRHRRGAHDGVRVRGFPGGTARGGGLPPGGGAIAHMRLLM